MRVSRLTFVAACIAALIGCGGPGQAAPTGDPVLTQTIVALDQEMFEAYNHCDMKAFAALFTSDVEFYHDDGGVTFGRRPVIQNTRKFICHKVRRELVPGTLRVYPIKGFGAIEEGEHQFVPIGSSQAVGVAKFVMIWRRQSGVWKVSRVMSYGHMAAGRPVQPAGG